MIRRLLLLVAALLIAATLGTVLLLDRIELAGVAAARASASLGRDVTIRSLRVSSIGPWPRLSLQEASVANAEGGTEPAMARLTRLETEFSLRDLLLGRGLVVRTVRVEGFSLLLEHGTGPGRDQPNWQFSPAGAEPGTAGRSRLPLVMDATVADAELRFRTTGGNILRVRIEEARIVAPGAALPVSLDATGRYNDTPLHLVATSGPVSVLRADDTPYPVDVAITSGDTRLTFAGTLADPLNLDGAAGRLTLAAPRLTTLLSAAGVAARPLASIDIAGDLTREGDVWRLAQAAGSIAGSPATIRLAELTEGARGRPDGIMLDATIERLNLNRILGPAAAEAAEQDADMPLDLDPEQDPLLQVTLSVGTLTYARLQATGLRLVGSLGPGTATIEELALTTSGAQISATLRATRQPHDRARIDAEVSMTDAEIEAMRRTIGLRALPVGGRVDGRVLVAAEGRSLNHAAHDASVMAVLGLRQGYIAEEVIERASTDLRLLFRRARGRTPLRCMLGVLVMRGGVGEVGPLRLRAATGTIAGLATFDLNRRRLDAVVGSQRDTTDFWALDIPMRISGRFDNPEIRPAQWSADGRAKLAAMDQMAPLPAALRSFARQNACAQPRP